jgi:hypothetical protein
MRRLALCVLVLSVAGCPSRCGDKHLAPADTARADTTPVDLNAVKTDIPAAAPDTFTPPKQDTRPPLPPAPPALLEAVEREQSFSKFCFQEFGEKSDPTLRGGVAMVVTIGTDGITDARVAADTWSSRAGKPVNDCLNAKAARAWKAPAGEVKPGKYVVQLSFRPS